MKHNQLARLLIVFATLLPITLPALAQNALWECPSVSSKSTLVRQYQDNVEIIFHSSVNSSFLYVDRNSGIITEAQLPVPIKVEDMEIAGDTLYFCGNKSDTNFLCLLDIPGTFLVLRQ